MAQPLQPLRAAERVDAPVRDVRLLADDLASTHGTLRGHLPARLGVLDADDFGDDIARPMDDNAGSDVHALFVDLRLVVHRHVADGHAADHHRRDVGDRCEHAGAADVAGDLFHRRLCLLRRVLEGDRPAGRACDETKLELLRETVDLDHHTVDLMLQLMASSLPLGVILDHLFDRVEPSAVLVDAEPHLLQRPQHVPLRPVRSARVEGVHERLQVAARRHVGVDLADAAGRGVARIDIANLAGSLHLTVQLLECGDRKVDLPPHLEHIGQAGRRRDRQGHAADGAQVGRHVLAHGPIAAGRRSLQPAFRVGEADREVSGGAPWRTVRTPLHQPAAWASRRSRGQAARPRSGAARETARRTPRR